MQNGSVYSAPPHIKQFVIDVPFSSSQSSSICWRTLYEFGMALGRICNVFFSFFKSLCLYRIVTHWPYESVWIGILRVSLYYFFIGDFFIFSVYAAQKQIQLVHTNKKRKINETKTLGDNKIYTNRFEQKKKNKKKTRKIDWFAFFVY